MSLWKKAVIGIAAVLTLGAGANFVAMAASSDDTVGVVDISGPCDEAEHANDPRCTVAGADAREDDSAAGRNEDRSGRDGDNDDRSGRDGDNDDRSGRDGDNDDRSGRDDDNDDRSGHDDDNDDRSGHDEDSDDDNSGPGSGDED